jgi:membrane protease YdiL (CAAX protease family)
MQPRYEEEIMATVEAFIDRHPVLTYFALTFAISWGGMLLIIGGPGAIPAAEGQVDRLMLFVYLELLAGPSAAAILLTGLVDGQAGMREFGSRLLKWRVDARWYAVALLTAPLVVTATLLVLSLTSPGYLPRIYTADDKAFLLQFSIVSALIVAIFEELGWTGFVTPRLRQRYGVLATGLILGLLVGAWQFLVVYWVSGGSSGGLPPALFLAGSLFTWQPTYRVLMVWVYDRAASLPVAMLMHTSLIAFWTMSTPLTITGGALVSYYLVLSAALWVAIGVVVVANRGQLSPRPAQTGMA